MNIQTITQETSTVSVDWYYSRKAAKVIELGRENGMEFNFVGHGELPEERVYLKDWWYETLESLTNIPSEGLERLVLLKKAGIQIKGYVIAHQVPPNPETQPTAEPERQGEPEPAKNNPSVEIDLKPAVKTILEILGGIAVVFGFLFVSAIQLDPMLIVVLQDDTWVSVYEWLE